jgi:hypothetical protein
MNFLLKAIERAIVGHCIELSVQKVTEGDDKDE